MLRFIVNRLLWMIPVLWLVGTVTFFLMHAAPGSPWDVRVGGKNISPELEKSFNRKYGLDKPLVVQYLIYWRNVLKLDFGQSYSNESQTVVQRIMAGFPYSARIGLYAWVMALVLGISLGIIAALKQNTWIDYVSLFFATVGYTIPSFVLGIFLLIIFAVKLGWVPVLFAGWKSYILPSVALGLSTAAFIARLTRASVLEIIRQDYIRTARAKGLPPRIINLRHIVRNALIPVVTISGPALASLITGTIIIENVFNVPGMGYLFIQSISARDYPVIMGTTLFYTFFIVIGNLLVDLTYGLVDPRIKTS
ncbi:binding-protein-dependent transport systems inner membrane component [Thermobaculum terrenum ATCC BAA-798]|uniref:Binding-protein-dependent transport systems inner membrane component n=1 Tax=Thermobaculum terrenum (strain ATCC BAA-798 / CCMEE 7001 / YNP1) TaxID=525904 RepID=D1CEI4_THET1|nr:ABC transporter permease [Thermobaculum terrenum]ACZ41340.1 binding-protein-dependent transport systems inner membrane component [Thermobaculum terrenum ATCC BAA-798]